MITVAALSVLALVDCMLAGFRAAAGRNGRLDKRIYYLRAVQRAARWGALNIVLHLFLAMLLAMSADEPASAWDSMLAAARVCVWVYGAFAAVLLAAFGFYFAPIGDFRVLTNVLVFGPLTLARKLVITGGLLVAVVCVPDTRVFIMALSAGLTMLCFEPMFARGYEAQWRLLLPSSARSEATATSSPGHAD